MDILNNIVGKLLPGDDEHPGLAAFLSWVQDEGGLPTLLERFKELQGKDGMTGSFSPEHISHLFSDGELTSLAQHMGFSSEEVTEWVSGHLPALLQHVSSGELQQGSGSLLDSAWSFLRGRIK